MKKISVVIPCYKEEETVAAMHQRLIAVFKNDLQKYDYEIIFVDDCSPDNTWEEIKKVCAADKKTKGIHNVTNFGQHRNVFSSFKYGAGDAVFMLFGDLQDPPEMLVEFVRNWEDGHNVVVGQISKRKDNVFMAFMRRSYYRIIRDSSSAQIANFNGFGLYDKSFVAIFDKIDDMQPFLKGIVAEFGGNIKRIPYEQGASGRGRTSSSFFKSYDFAMAGITSYTKHLMRTVTFIGAIIGMASIIVAIVTLVNKIMNWDKFPFGLPALSIGMFFLGAVQLFFLGILGEYVLSINARSMKRPLVVTDKKLNFDEEPK
jgi:glycosyltransferase involved in cell wall biosynthesis